MGRPTPAKQTLLLVLFAHTVLPAVLAFVAFSHHQSPPTSLSVAYVLAAVCVAIALLLSFRLDGQMTASKFQSALIINLAVSELSSLFGFVFVGMSDGALYVPFAIATIAVNVLFILPRVLAYMAGS